MSGLLSRRPTTRSPWRLALYGLLAATSCKSHDKTVTKDEGSLSASAPKRGNEGDDPSEREASTPTPSTWQKPPSAALASLDRGQYVYFEGAPGDIPLVRAQVATPLWVSASDTPGVQRAATDLQMDLEKVGGVQPVILNELPTKASTIVLIGTLGSSPVLDRLVQSGKLDASPIEGRWETHLITTVPSPSPGIEQAIVIAGSDPRGTTFGIYDLSRQLGVSPWYFWDDVPVAAHSEVGVRPGRYSQGEPVVKYRGFFINDEEPQLGTWARATFGPAPNPNHAYAFNHQMYAKVYELMLRLKANYLWPAVWSRSLFDDDPRSQSLAAEYGIVMGTSHEAPMMRAQDEWNRYGSKEGPYGGNGAFSFARNETALEKYWADGLRRMNGYESLVTVGMRGNGDTGMEDAAGTELMMRIVSSQRKTIENVLGKPAKEVPQVWTLYKEVQDYWDAGMRAPDDVTIIWCDDNWGNMRGLPDANMAPRQGGYGLYYHFDYVGGSRNYKWVDTTSLPNLWEQLHLSYRYGVDRVWMTNVGDLKNDEHPLDFFLQYAWDPMRIQLDQLHQWEVQWAAERFGPASAESIASVVERYGQLQARRKPELLNRKTTLDPRYKLSNPKQVASAVVYHDASPFSLVHYREAERVTEQWAQLAAKSEKLRGELPEQFRDAYYQLVHYAVAATANVYALRLAQFNNLRYAEQGRAATNSLAKRVDELFAKDQAMSEFYNTELSDGKWQGWQTQAKLGYGGNYPNSSWQQPQKDGQALPDFVWPPVKTIEVPNAALLSVALDGSEQLLDANSSPQAARLPTFSPYQSQPAQFIEVVNRGRRPFDYTVSADVPWVHITQASGTVQEQVRAEVTVDWTTAPAGKRDVTLTVKGAGEQIQVLAPVDHVQLGTQNVHAYVEANGYLSVEGAHYHRSVQRNGIRFERIGGIGRTLDGMTPMPVNAPRQVPDKNGVRLEYQVHTFSQGPVEVTAYLSPRNDVRSDKGLQYAISIDDETPQIVDLIGQLNAVVPNRSWERNTSDNVTRVTTQHSLTKPGTHTLRFWMVDPTVILQKLVVDTGGVEDSYLGPPESFRGE